MSVVTSSVIDMGTARVVGVVGSDSPAGVLAEVGAHRVAAEAHEAAILRAAAEWADLHPPESLDEAACVPGTQGEVAIAGVGAPRVAEFACAEFAAALGVPTTWGTQLVGEALELRHRLPRVWARVMAGDLPVWRARRIARATMPLSRDAAGWVDAQVAGFAHRVGPAQTDRLVAAAAARFDPDLADSERQAAADRRCFEVDHRQVSFAGTSRVYGELDLADALDLDAAVAAGAEELARLGSTETLAVRRALAAGELARRQPTLDLTDPQQSDPAEPPERSAGSRRPSRRVARQTVLYVHLSQAAITGAGGVAGEVVADPVARVENAGGVRLVTAEQVRAWCGRPEARVVVKPVIDLADHVSVDAYEVPDRLAERVGLRHPTCVFPWCARPARRCDIDHGVAYDERGPTCECNLAPLCRFHHRLKTHGAGCSPGSTRPPSCGAHPTAWCSCATTPAPLTSPTRTPDRTPTHPTGSHPAPRPATAGPSPAQRGRRCAHAPVGHLLLVLPGPRWSWRSLCNRHEARVTVRTAPGAVTGFRRAVASSQARSRACSCASPRRAFVPHARLLA
jgi:hypothetical protein